MDTQVDLWTVNVEWTSLDVDVVVNLSLLPLGIHLDETDCNSSLQDMKLTTHEWHFKNTPFDWLMLGQMTKLETAGDRLLVDLDWKKTFDVKITGW